MIAIFIGKKLHSKITSVNIVFLIFIIIFTFKFMNELRLPLYSIQSGGILKELDCTMTDIKFKISESGRINTYEIVYYPLISISAAVLYNFFIKIKMRIYEKLKSIQSKS